MKLYIFGNKGFWESSDSYPLPRTVEVIPSPIAGVANINGQPVGITGGAFPLPELHDGVNTVEVNGVSCESLFCRTVNGSVRRVHAITEDLRGLLPYIARIEELESAVERIEAQFKQKDFFG